MSSLNNSFLNAQRRPSLFPFYLNKENMYNAKYIFISLNVCGYGFVILLLLYVQLCLLKEA